MSSPSINILFVAFEFPPLSSGGVQRSLKFVKYLPDFGINPIVITVDEGDYAHVLNNGNIDSALSAEIPPGITIERIHCSSPSTPKNKLAAWSRIYFSVTENFKTYWFKSLQEKLPGIISKYSPKAIYITIPPFAMAPLWIRLLKGNHIPLLIDFRDAWSQWAVAPNGSYFHYHTKLKQEAAILKKASAVVTTSIQTKEELQQLHNNISPEKFAVISNGYDGALNIASQIAIFPNKKIRIGYVGSFYYSPEAREEIFKPWWKKKPHRMLNYVPRKEDWLYRSPYFFLKSMKYLLDQNKELAGKIDIHFAGKTPSWLQGQIDEFGLGHICTHHGHLLHDAVVEFQHSCDALLITSSKVIGGKDYSIAGKTFEYFTIGKPIIGFVCEGAQKDILMETGMSVICDPDNTSESAAKMKALFDGTLVLHPDKKAIEKYHRKNVTQQLATVIESII